jgi:hypothetical protein
VVPVDEVYRDPRVVGSSDLFANVISVFRDYPVVKHVASVDDSVDINISGTGEAPTQSLSVVDLPGPRRFRTWMPMSIPDVRITDDEES